MDAPKDEEEGRGEDEDEDEGETKDKDKDQVLAATCDQSRASMRLSPRLATARPQRATHLRLQLVAARSERASHLALYLIVSRSHWQCACLRDGVEDLLVCSGNM